MQNNMIWKCPNCETINKGGRCQVCGELKPIDSNSNNNLEDIESELINKKHHEDYEQAYKEVNAQFKKSRISFVIVLMLLIIIIFVLIIIMGLKNLPYVHNTDETNAIDVMTIDVMNSNAQLIFKTAMEYSVECAKKGNLVSDGVYYGDLIKSTSSVVFDGSADDMKLYFKNRIYQDELQYYGIIVNNGYPSTAYWSYDSLDDTINGLTQEKIIVQNLMIGIYPQYNSVDTSYQAADISSDNVKTESNITDSNFFYAFDPIIFDKKILECVNKERSDINLYGLKSNNNLLSIEEKLMVEIYNRTYEKGSSKKYFLDTFDYGTFYYEENFDLSVYSNYEEAAQALLDYEKENFSSRWLDKEFQYFELNALKNNDGTYSIVFCLAGDKTINIKGETYERNLLVLDLCDKDLIPPDITDLPYMYNLEVLKLDNNSISGTDVFGKLPKLKELWLDNNGINTLSFLNNCKNIETLTLNKNNISDLTPLSNLTKLKNLYIRYNNISDLSPLESLNNLEEVEYVGNKVE